MVYKIIRMECQREYEVPMCRMYLIIQGIEIMEYEPYQAKSVNSHDHTKHVFLKNIVVSFLMPASH